MAKRTTWLALLLTGLVSTAYAETINEVEEVEATTEKTTVELPAWVKNIKFSGYGMLQYQGQDPEGNHSNTFNLRLARFILDGKIGDFDWRAQIQGTNVKGPGEPTVQLVDLYAEWRKYPEFKVRAGQFKRAFTFENPTHPITQGWYAYANVINALSGFGDRTGEKSSGGRDIGLQISGDVLPNASGRKLLHYQVGVYNGEGINQKDKDNKKDIIGGLWVMPIQGVRIGLVHVTVSATRTVTVSLLSMTRTSTPSAQSICTHRVTAPMSPSATRPTVGMPSASCLSPRASCTPKRVISVIATIRSGDVPRRCTRWVSTISSRRVCN